MLSRIDIFKRRQRAYRDIFGAEDPATRRVIADLKRFCRHNQSTYTNDPYKSAYLNGRRDVLERIFSYLNLTEDQINAMKENLDV